MPEDAPVMTIVLPSRRFAIADAIALLAICELRDSQKVCELKEEHFGVFEKARKGRGESI